MNVGALDRRITIERKVETRDTAYNTAVVSWVPLAQVWANVQDAMPSRQESLVDGALVMHTGKTRIRIRWLRDLDTSCRVRIHRPVERVLAIVGGPAEIGGNRAFMEIMCEEFST
jgi:SPP1 family predicted phage head-tail adaptor